MARGCAPIRFDNRDAGLSTHFHDAPVPDLSAALAGDLSSAAYTLSDLAADTVGLLDALGLDSAHLVGASLGGMIAQTVAIEHPARIRSLTSIMSTTGAPGVGGPDHEVLSQLAGPPPTGRADVIEHSVKAFRLLGSPGFPTDESELRERAALAYDRAYDPLGMMRQTVAVVASGDRTERLHSVRVPALVIHGADDRMCDVSGGRATAEAIAGAELVVIDGMGHNLPRQLWSDLAARIASLVHRTETDRTGSGRTEGDRSRADRSPADHTSGNRTLGNRTLGDRTWGDRVGGGHAEADRTGTGHAEADRTDTGG
ncbi:alpha/beta fold hydrolase [Nonomuraea gerenzanensis]|uniref:Beta-ketoadipate enol-lactone hydrolase n=1 Tax=Nonomuraea gerenzanensis TaxID=93944 RepID=A0A1M4E1F0_9ACTN|nr:alpha/beta fold hydrolase [Nonomuraea gerenzanensis]SBO92596.1 Beta-ketoadipate enol-lactone hydrolase [Nonomuraea gerenzanensis]